MTSTRIGGYGSSSSDPNGSGAQGDAPQDQREAAEGRGAEALAEEDRSVRERDRRNQICHE